jgi:UDP-3-O-[3-hydroxymyristoyl] glucosamine N-acyltransferase
VASSTHTTGSLAATLSARLVGRGDLPITAIATIETAAAGCLTFIRDEKYAKQWATSGASAAVVVEGLTIADHDEQSRALLFVKEADLALATCLELLHPGAADLHAEVGVHPTAVVHPTAHVDPTARIGPFCYVGPEASIGADTVLHAHVTVMDRCIIGSRCIMQPGVVIGGDGFAYRPAPDKAWPGGMKLAKLPHIGNVVIGDEVEIGSGTCVDRGRLGSTTIGDGTKLDNLVQIGHNCRIGKCCVICGQAGMAGSVTLGDWVQVGGGVGIGDNLQIGSGVKIAAKSAVMNDIPAGQTWAGLPAMAGREYFRVLAALRKLGKGPG